MEQNSPLLKLPEELRDHIYHFALITDDIAITDFKLKEPAFLATCRQVRGEALAIYYKSNRFLFHVTSNMVWPAYLWFEIAGPMRCGLMTNLLLENNSSTQFEPLSKSRLTHEMEHDRQPAHVNFDRREASMHITELKENGVKLDAISFVAPAQPRCLADVLKVTYKEAGDYVLASMKAAASNRNPEGDRVG